jgi:hypothetical protein
MTTYTASNVKTFTGMDGQGFNMVLKRDGKPIAEVIDEGRGGAVIFNWKDHETRATVAALDYQGKAAPYVGTEEEAALWAHCRTLPSIELSEMTLQCNPELFVAELIWAVESRKRLTRMLKTKIVYIDAGKPYTYPVKAGQSHDDIASLVRANRPNAKILNGLPIEEAIPLALAAKL